MLLNETLMQCYRNTTAWTSKMHISVHNIYTAVLSIRHFAWAHIEIRQLHNLCVLFGQITVNLTWIWCTYPTISFNRFIYDGPSTVQPRTSGAHWYSCITSTKTSL